jgi:hypothetical protein
VNEPVAILMNRCEPDGEWIAFDLVGIVSPRDAVGAIVTLKTSAGTQNRDWKGGGSYASTNARALHFGIPKDAKIETVSIRWPSGLTQQIDEVEAGRVNRVVESPSTPTNSK